LKSETVFAGKDITLRRDTVQLPSGEPFEHDIAERPEEITVIPQISEKELIMVKQFRRGVQEILLELPGGKISAGERAEEAARRELEEETGYQAGEMRELREIFFAPGWSTIKKTFFLARELKAAKNPHPADLDENIEVVKLTFEEALAKAESGEIKDAKSILGLSLVKKFFASS